MKVSKTRSRVKKCLTVIRVSYPTDRNECLTLNGGCTHSCSNTEGSFVCGCRDGFMLGEDGRTCGDVDECQNSPCDHTCSNLIGGFRCHCNAGYILDGADMISCNGEWNTVCFSEVGAIDISNISQILMSVFLTMAAVHTTASTSRAATGVPAEITSCYNLTVDPVKT